MSDELDLDEIIIDSEDRMQKSLSVFDTELSKIRTGRASTALVEDILVDYYGVQTPINQMSTITIPEATTIMIQPWDVSAVGEIEKAILKSDLGINPSNDGKIIRLNLPALTEERRRELVKYVGKIAEEFRVSIRQIRKDVNHSLKQIEKDGHVSEDDVKSHESMVQDLTDEYIKKINARLERKEKEIMEV